MPAIERNPLPELPHDRIARQLKARADIDADRAKVLEALYPGASAAVDDGVNVLHAMGPESFATWAADQRSARTLALKAAEDVITKVMDAMYPGAAGYVQRGLAIYAERGAEGFSDWVMAQRSGR